VSGQPVHVIRETGFACIPEDRYKHGCAAGATLTETSIMGHQYKKELSHKGILKRKNISGFAKNLIEKYAVKTSGTAQLSGELSGGNIQKLIAAREIEQNTPFLLAAEPTRGVDIGAMEFIHDKLLKRRKEGCAILLISSELTEIRKLCDRIYTIYNGELNQEFTREEATEESLGLMMMGGKKHG
jgi:simple sugar transport system ATP-binding protein